MTIDIIPVVISVMAKAVHTPVGPVKTENICARKNDYHIPKQRYDKR